MDNEYGKRLLEYCTLQALPLLPGLAYGCGGVTEKSKGAVSDICVGDICKYTLHITGPYPSTVSDVDLSPLSNLLACLDFVHRFTGGSYYAM